MAKATKRRIKGLKLRGEFWWWRGRVKVDGVSKRIWRSTGCHDFESAQLRALDMQRELRDTRFGWKKDVPTWDTWVATYTATYLPEKAAGTQRRDAGTLAHALPYFTGKPLDAIRQSDCLKYLQARRASLTSNPGRKTQTPLAEGTIQRERRLLQAIFQRAVDDGLLDRNPWRGIERVPDVARHLVLLAADETLIRACLSPRFDRWLTFLLQTGLRLEECRGIDPKRHILDGHVRVTGKGSKVRDVPLTPAALEALRGQQDADGKLWDQNPQRLREVLAVASRRSGTGHFSPHDMRHTFGHRWLQRGGDIYTLCRILGHSSVTVTERHYAYLLKEDIAAKMLAVMAPGAA
jgi:integrase